MSGRSKKFIGVFVFVVFTTFYFLMAISIAVARLPNTSTAVQLLFYFVVTAIWLLASAGIIWLASNKADPETARRYL